MGPGSPGLPTRAQRPRPSAVAQSMGCFPAPALPNRWQATPDLRLFRPGRRALDHPVILGCRVHPGAISLLELTGSAGAGPGATGSLHLQRPPWAWTSSPGGSQDRRPRPAAGPKTSRTDWYESTAVAGRPPDRGSTLCTGWNLRPAPTRIALSRRNPCVVVSRSGYGAARTPQAVSRDSGPLPPGPGRFLLGRAASLRFPAPPVARASPHPRQQVEVGGSWAWG